jgi:hypothetical protein
LLSQASKRQRFGGAPFAADPYPHMAHHPLELDPPMPGMLLPGGQLDNAAAYLDLMQHLPPGLPDTSGLPSAPVLAMAAAGGQVQQLAGLVGGGTPFEHDPIAAFADYMIHLQQQATQGSAMHAATTLPPSLRSQPIAPQQASASMHGALLNAQQHAQLAKLQRMRDDPDGFHGTPPLSSKPLFTGGGGGGGGSGGGNGGLARLSSLDKSGAQGGSMGGTGAGAYSSLHGCRDFSPLRLPNTPPSLSTPTPSALDDLFCSIQPSEPAARLRPDRPDVRPPASVPPHLLLLRLRCLTASRRPCMCSSRVGCGGFHEPGGVAVWRPDVQRLRLADGWDAVSAPENPPPPALCAPS